MDDYHNVRRELQDGRAFLAMIATRTALDMIATVANVTQAEVLRLIELAKADAAKK